MNFSPENTLSPAIIESIVRMALAEDAPWGDLTSQALIPHDVDAVADLVSRETGIFSGGELFRAAFVQCDSAVSVEIFCADGEKVHPGMTLASVSGRAQPILQAERVALNLVQHLSGIATLTAAYVSQVRGTKARIVDTRKTTPGLRILQRHAVRSGGGHNHRFSLSDAVLVKDNHLALLAADDSRALTQALRNLRACLPHTTHLEVEVDRIDQIDAVLAAEVDTIMLDNFSLDHLREGVKIVAGRARVEASGGVTLDTVRSIAETGVDLISVGALTHSVRSCDFGLDVRTPSPGSAA